MLNSVDWDALVTLEWSEDAPTGTPPVQLVRPNRKKHFDTLTRAVEFASTLNPGQIQTAVIFHANGIYQGEDIERLIGQRPGR